MGFAVVMLFAAACENGNGTRSVQEPAVSLPCQNSIESLDGPASDGGHAVVLGRVELPTGGALGASRTAEDPEFPLFAKDGLVIKAGTSFELIVPRAWRSRLRIGWGSPAQPTTRLQVSRCPAANPTKPSLAYAGGCLVSEPACVSLIVEAGNRSQRVRIGVGAACPGQAEPPASVDPP
jgi:hypothetical protein